MLEHAQKLNNLHRQMVNLVWVRLSLWIATLHKALTRPYISLQVEGQSHG